MTKTAQGKEMTTDDVSAATDWVTSGRGATTYERGLRTEELLDLQRPPQDRITRDELLFFVVHQTTELWLKLAVNEIDDACSHLERGEFGASIRLIRRANECLGLITESLHVLEHMSPWEYHALRPLLVGGSGYDSPGFREVKRVTGLLWGTFESVLERAELTIVQLYQQGRAREDLYQLAEQLTEWDERIAHWRFRHIQALERMIGQGATGSAGTPVEVVRRLVERKQFPALWHARDELTSLADLDITTAARRPSSDESRTWQTREEGK